jgi:hypothetical protein
MYFLGKTGGLPNEEEELLRKVAEPINRQHASTKTKNRGTTTDDIKGQNEAKQASKLIYTVAVVEKLFVVVEKIADKKRWRGLFYFFYLST